jgi:hypothetical protein
MKAKVLTAIFVLGFLFGISAIFEFINSQNPVDIKRAAVIEVYEYYRKPSIHRAAKMKIDGVEERFELRPHGFDYRGEEYEQLKSIAENHGCIRFHTSGNSVLGREIEEIKDVSCS